MPDYFLPTNEDIRSLFENEVNRLGGEVTNVYNRHNMLFLRSVMPTRLLVRSTDGSRGGVALRAQNGEVSVHPYVFREICKNGAITALALSTKLIKCHDLSAAGEQVEEILNDLSAAICECADKKLLRKSVDAMQHAADVPADVTMLLTLAGLTGNSDLITQYLDAIAKQFTREDSTVYGLMNAVTATARDTRDPEDRWRLEELGGGAPALLSPVRKPSGAAAVLV